MDSKRIALYFIFSLATLYLWTQWNAQHPAPPPVSANSAEGSKSSGATPEPVAQTVTLLHDKTVVLTTNVITADIDTVGGDIRTLHLRKYGALENKKQPFQVFDDGKEHVYVAQTGFLNDRDAEYPNILPDRNTVFTSEGVKPGIDKDGKKTVTLTLSKTTNIATVRKIFILHDDSYVIDIKYEVENRLTHALTPVAYFKLVRDGKEIATTTRGSNSFTGPALFTDAEKYQKYPFKKLDPESNGSSNAVSRRVNDGWLAMVQHYFTSAWLLNEPSTENGDIKSPCQKHNCTVAIEKNEKPLLAGGKSYDDTYVASVSIDMDAIAPNKTGTLSMPLFVGPESNDAFNAPRVHDLAPELYLTKDYGWQRVIAEPLFLVLVFLHKLVSNWGIAIVSLTLLIKAAFFPLSRASFRSMAKMKKLMPRMQELKEKHGDDKVKYQQAVMEMYKTENANPMGGCLPVLIQIPVFLALYSVLQSAVELRQAPFFGWIQDLSLSDPYYVLPAILAVTMYAQTMLNPPPTDPVQAKMMKFMPLVFSAMFFLLPVGLVVYYIVNNLLSILQQWYVNRQLEA